MNDRSGWTFTYRWLAWLGASLVVVPLVALARRTAWSSLWSDLGAPSARTALGVSLVCSLGALVITIVLGSPLAWWLARGNSRLRNLVRGLVMLPLVLPPVVGGIALLSAFSRTGVVGSWLYSCFGIQLTFQTSGAMLAEAFVALPLYVLTIDAALVAFDHSAEELAATLGADRVAIWWRVTLPSIRPAVLAAVSLAWARALGEFGATVTFAGNIAGRTQTLPLAIYLELESNPQGALALSMLLLAVSLLVTVGVRGRWVSRVGSRGESSQP